MIISNIRHHQFTGATVTDIESVISALFSFVSISKKNMNFQISDRKVLTNVRNCNIRKLIPTLESY